MTDALLFQMESQLQDDVRAHEFDAQIINSRWSPEFAGVQPRAPPTRRSVRCVDVGRGRVTMGSLRRKPLALGRTPE